MIDDEENVPIINAHA